MTERRRENRFWGLGAAFALAAAFARPSSLFAQNSLCAVVKLQIQQQATLEREAFDAMLTITNSVPQPLTNLRVLINFTDSNGNPATQSFFVSTNSLQNVSAVDGTGIIQSSNTATIHWLIIPSSGTGGINPLGMQYGVTAMITGNSGGLPQSITTFPAFITVHPQPLLKLEYSLPFEVFGQQPLLLPQITPVIPFPLGVRVTNIGFGAANNFQINSARPQIVENKQGLLVDFKLLDSVVNGVLVTPPTLLINFGNLKSQGVGQASWDMTSSLAGFFTDFSSTFTHAADLGGQLTSLIQSVTTYTLVKDVLDDQPGHDAIPDFLVNRNFPRSQMQALLDSGAEPQPDVMLESDQPSPVPIVNVGGTLTGQLSGTNSTLTVTLASGTGSGLWAHFSAAFPTNSFQLASARRSDGKNLNSHNFWISQHFNTNTLQSNFHLHILDFTSTAQQYVLTFNASALDTPPAAVADLSATTGASGGRINLSWTAPGEDGNSGNILGGKYFIQTSTDPNAVFASSAAQIVFATSTPAGAAQSFTLANLAGNATYFIRLFTADAGGNISPVSNGATAYVLPNTPQNLSFFSVTTTSVAVNFQTGNNLPPVANRILVSSALGGPFVSSTAFLASSISSAAFIGLSPATTYFFFGQAENPAIQAFSQAEFLASTITLPLPISVDTTPPVALLLSPSSSARGVDQVFGKSMIPVMGTVTDLNLQSWTLSVAAGANAASGFSTLATSTVSVFSSTLTVWNTSGLAGFFTLELAAADAVANLTVTTATVFIGDPGLSMVLRNAKASHGKGRLENPSGVAVDATGRIFVANTGRNEVIVFSSTGTVLASFDGRTVVDDRALSQESAASEDSREAAKKKTVFFNSPVGLALAPATSSGTAVLGGISEGDTTGQIYVADRDNDRIAILTSTGAVVRSLGKRNSAGFFVSGSGPGEFNHPTGVAVSTDRIVVADRNNGRVQVFGLGGNFLFQIKLSAMPSPSSDHEAEDAEEEGRAGNGRHNGGENNNDDHDNEDNAKPAPFGAAMDIAGNIYVTEETTDRVQVFDRLGNPLYALGRKGTLLGQFRDPKGVAVSSLTYVYAADSNNHRIEKFDPFQGPVLAFRLGITPSPHTGGSEEGRPVGMALDGVGNLFVTDRKNEAILKFGLPASTATIIVEVPPVKSVKRVVDARGGRVQRDDGVRVDLPPGALNDEIEITIDPQRPRPPSEHARMAGYLEQNKIAAASEGVELGPEGTVFSKPVVVTLAYDPAGLPQGAGESDLKIYSWNSNTLAWERMESSVDTSSQTVSAITSHFSLYQILAPSGPQVVADPTFKLGDIFVFPNPARGGLKPTFHVEVGIADSVQIKVYSVSGRPVMETELSGTPPIIDSGSGPRYAYEYVWDGHIASGVYLYVVTAKGAGNKLTKTGKCAVVR